MILVVGESLFFLNHSQKKQEMRPIIESLKKFSQAGDVLYLNNSAQYAFAYYAGMYGLENYFQEIIKFSDKVLERDGKVMLSMQYADYELSPEHYVAWEESKIQKFSIRQSPRVWILLDAPHGSLESMLLDFLNKSGVMIEAYKDVDVSLYLYNLNS